MKRMAVVLALSLVGVACGSGEDAEPAATTAASTTTSIVTTTTSIAATTTVPPTTVVSPFVTTRQFSVPATVDVSVGGAFTKRRDTDVAVDFSSNSVSGGFVVLTTLGKNSTDDWVVFLADDDQVTTGDPAEYSIGGLAATFIDVMPGALNVKLFSSQANSYTWDALPGHIDRIYTVEVEGEFVNIVAEAPVDRFDVFIADVELLLATLVWG